MPAVNPGGGTQDLRVDPGVVRESGGKIGEIAGSIPDAPTPYKPAGGDPLSSAIAAKVAEVVDPIIPQVPKVKNSLSGYAEKVKAAANHYENTDSQLASKITEQTSKLDQLANQTYQA
ncbi:hypothetical protein MHAS_04175 [Mycolicibacterium hassiacum DSM 44199]|jgi:hypothetical protein|uniref:type VII secretion target n=1 Tax=Mycolicibacterium hassiacum TaxID=46351 RepID=UPI0009DA96FA|nr:type VII secretion target [Mycolicibacterium hassiacum]MBX5489187.1 hypothetical protein [Mycolicibacterium hassiacum]PZN22185.1 MAG: hypothetical protein DIU75_08365 [Mycolicibacterium hassiacum]VCT92448.1 hypothetical protein MHAS_04175 [Mycolicibacterium hassiacum DSM 44199]